MDNTKLQHDKSSYHSLNIKLFKEVQLPDGTEYTGEMKDGKRHGYGVSICKDGSQFTGYYLDDKLNGQALAFYSSGNRYEGDWKDN